MPAALTPTRLRDAILGKLLGATSVWRDSTFEPNLRRALQSTLLDLGCWLKHASFEQTRTLQISNPDESLVFFTSAC